MKRIACLLTLMTIAGCSSGPRNQPTSSPEPVAITTNLAFEGGLGAGGLPTDWTGGGVGYELTVDTTEKHGGAASGRIRLVTSSASPNAFGTMTKCTNAGPLTDAKIIYAGFLKTADVVGWSGLWFRVDGPTEGGERKTLAFDNMQDRPVRGTTDWGRQEVVLNVPKEALGVCFGFLLSGGGTVWGDDLSVSLSTSNSGN